jgi:PAS domain S-box-containing protein
MTSPGAPRSASPGSGTGIAVLAEHPAGRLVAALLAGTVLLGLGWLVWQPDLALLRTFHLSVHSLLETCSIIVCVMVLAVSRASFGDRRNRNMTLIGAACLGVALLDYLHVQSYLGMPDLVTPSSPSKAIAFWLAARLLAAAALVWLAFTSWDRMIPSWHFGLWVGGVLVVVALVAGIVLWRPHWLPDTYVDGHGLTGFKISAEILIIALNVIAAYGFHRLVGLSIRQRPSLGRFDPCCLMAAAIVTALSEIFFSLYTDVHGGLNLVGHVYKVIAAWLLYRGLVATNLHEIETLSRMALDAAAVGAWSWDIRRDYVERDAATAQIWGVPTDIATTMNALEDFVHPDDRALRASALQAALDPESSGLYRAEFRVFRPGSQSGGGGLRRVLALGRTEFRDGRPVRMIGISRDVTEDRRVELTARSLEARLSSVLAIAADAIISIDEKSRIVMFNHGAEVIFGYPAEEIIGQPLEVLLPPRYRAAHGGHVRTFAASSVTARRMGERTEIFALAKSRREFPAEASISRLDEDGVPFFTVVLRDVTERKVAERRMAEVNVELGRQVAEQTRELQAEMQRREQAQTALAQAQRMEAFGQLAGGIAHDFNNLLTVITGNQELLEMRLQDPKQLGLLKRANEAAEMGARLTARLLTFARRRRLEPSLLDLNEQIIGMVELLRRSIGQQVTLTTNLAPRLGAVRADPSEIENAVLNLVINARDAMVGGGMLVIETADCCLEAGEVGRDAKLPAGDYVRLSVSDTGTGMSSEVLQHAFEPFFTTKEPGKGTGLGLSTIYGFVQQSGGTVTAYSEVGRGTTISIYLPRASDEGGVSGIRSEPSEVPAGAGEIILVAEDDEAVRIVTRQRLEDLGYRVLEAEDARKAIELLQSAREPVQLVLSDVVMPGGMSGFDLARWVATNAPTVRVVLSSGYPDEIARSHEGKLPAVRLLRKPYNRIELARAMRAALDS